MLEFDCFAVNDTVHHLSHGNTFFQCWRCRENPILVDYNPDVLDCEVPLAA
jgi:hypothetical protein